MDKRLLQIFLEVTAINAVSSNERPVADYITEFLKKYGLEPFEDNSAVASSGNCGNVICTVGTGGDKVLLSHMDTARPTLNVKPVLGSDRITSDGTTVLGVDNRAGIAALLYAVEKLHAEASLQTPEKYKGGGGIPGNFTLAFTIQEETTLNGSASLRLNDSIKMGFVFDSHSRPGHFIVESAGSVGFDATIFGRAAHSGIAPEKGIDSVKIAGVAISRIQLGRIDEDTTANIGVIKGGSATNVVPEQTFLEGEVRSMVKEKLDNCLNNIKDTFIRTAGEYGGRVEFNSYWNFRPYRVREESRTYKTAVKVLSECGLEPKPETSRGGSDANSLNAKGIDCVNLGIGAENPHSNDEFILYEDLEKAAEIAAGLMKL